MSNFCQHFKTMKPVLFQMFELLEELMVVGMSKADTDSDIQADMLNNRKLWRLDDSVQFMKVIKK